MAPTGTRNKTNTAASNDLSKMNPALSQMKPPEPVHRGGRDPIIGQAVAVTQGPYKGQWGIIKDASGSLCRLELHSKSGIISIDKSKLQLRDARGNLRSLDTLLPRPGMMTGTNGVSVSSNGSATPSTNPYTSSAYDGRTPAYGGRTPAYGMGGKTPAYGSDGRTPNYGGRTPAWSTSSRTPNPYADGGKTPAWQVGSKTPNPYAFDPGSKTPGYAWDAGSKTPRYGGNAFDAGGRTPGYGAGASTPYGGAPTPGAYNAPTPSFSSSALTPGVNPWAAANEPGGGDDDDDQAAPTPNVGRYESSTTPAAGISFGMTPGGQGAPTPAPSTTAYQSDAAAIALIGSQWLYDGIQVRIRPAVSGTSHNNGIYNGREGKVVGVNASRDQAIGVDISGGKYVAGVRSEHLEPVRPSDRRQSIRVIGGPLIGKQGTVISWDGTEGMVALDDINGHPVIEGAYLARI